MTLSFLYRVFELNPQIKKMMPEFMTDDPIEELRSSRKLFGHSKTLMKCLENAVTSLDDNERFVAYLVELGRRHQVRPLKASYLEVSNVCMSWMKRTVYHYRNNDHYSLPPPPQLLWYFLKICNTRVITATLLFLWEELFCSSTKYPLAANFLWSFHLPEWYVLRWCYNHKYFLILPPPSVSMLLFLYCTVYILLSINEVISPLLNKFGLFIFSFLGDTRSPNVFLKGGFPVGVDNRNIRIVERLISIHDRGNDHRTSWHLDPPSSCLTIQPRTGILMFFIAFK